MSTAPQPLIVGAGPVGLAAALFLAQRGAPPRLIERREHASTESRALAVNPRTLDILEPTGVTARMLEIGRPIRGATFSTRRKQIGAVDLSNLPVRRPYLLALSQATSERLLAEALQQAGGVIERGVELEGCRSEGGRVEADLRRSDGSTETVECPWLLGADGAHSAVRHALGVGFQGSVFDQHWSLADAPLRTEFDRDHGHAFFLEDGRFLFLIPVVDDTPEDGRMAPIWRIVSNRPDPLEDLVRAEPDGPALWQSEFTVAHRIAGSLAAGNICLAGDAAHIHSPFGARGMNLGIEDAAVFATLAQQGRLSEYDAMRRPIDRKVVRRVERLSEIASGVTPVDRFVRSFLLPIGIRIPVLRGQLKKMVTGLDHPMPGVLAT